MEKMASDGPKWGQDYFFSSNPDLADILGRTDLDFENSYFLDFLGPKILAWAHLGPTWQNVRTKTSCINRHQLRHIELSSLAVGHNRVHSYGCQTGTPWHGTERRTRRFMARHGTARKIMARKHIGTARHGKSWHGKILARHGPEKCHKIVFFFWKIFLVEKSETFS